MSDTEQSTHGIPKPNEKFHDAKKRTDNELKALNKSAKGKQGKELIATKEKEIEQELSKLKLHWDLYNRAEAGEDVKQEYATFTGEIIPSTTGSTTETNTTNLLLSNPMQQRELTKAQKKKLEKEEREADEDKSRQELIKSLPDLKKAENNKITTRLNKYQFDGKLKGKFGAQYVEVPGDGHCLFRAIRQQLTFLADKKGLYTTWFQHLDSKFVQSLETIYKIKFDTNLKELSTQTLRTMAACWIKLHADDYYPFLIEHDIFVDGGDIDTYCKAIIAQDKVLWGGECELNAFAAMFNTSIIVIQAKGENPKYNPQAKHKEEIGSIVITFHQYWTSAGAHYNGIELLKPKDEF